MSGPRAIRVMLLKAGSTGLWPGGSRARWRPAGDTDRRARLAPARGVVFGVLLGVLFWVAVALALFAVFI